MALIYGMLSFSTNAQNIPPYWSLKGNNNINELSKLGTVNNGRLNFITNNITRVSIFSNGDVKISGKFFVSDRTMLSGNTGIGIASSPVYKLLVSGNSFFKGDLNLTGKLVAHADLFSAVSLISDTLTTAYIKAKAGEIPVSAGLMVNGFSRFGGGVSGYGGIYGIQGQGTNIGVLGFTAEALAIGVRGVSFQYYGGYFLSNNATGLYAAGGPGFYAAEFDGNVYATGIYQTSDSRFKKDITDIDNGMKIINLLKPKNYGFISDKKLSSLHLPAGIHYGLLAQDIEAVLPGIVKESNHELTEVSDVKLPAEQEQGDRTQNENVSIKAVNYTELIPIMIKAIQELGEENENLKKKLSELEAKMEGYLKPVTSNEHSSGGSMKQIPGFTTTK